MDETGDLKLLLASRYPLIMAEAAEEQRFLEVLGAAAAPLGLPVWLWSAAHGLARVGGDPQYGTQDPLKALDFTADFADPAVFVFADAKEQLSHPVFLRRIKEFAQSNRTGQTFVFVAPRAVVPPELQGLALVWQLKPPTRDEIAMMIKRAVEDFGARNVSVRLGATGIDGLAAALSGLSMFEAQRLVQQAALRDGSLAEDDIAFVREQKARILDQSGALELVATDTSLDDIGGLGRLKDWLRLRGRAFEPAARTFGLEPPRGVLITGVPGCGKSLIAKTLARSWSMPLVSLNVGGLFGSYVGESEQRLRDALSSTEAMAPIVVWIDEIEKAFASGGTGDGGVSLRILGSFLQWMQERPEGIFVCATSNDVTTLPPELLRKGRFDEIFFVDLPSVEERAQIIGLQLAKRGRNASSFDIATLAEASDGFSGAEIEAAVVGAMYQAYASGMDVLTADIIVELHATVPLSRTRAEEVAALREWARTRTVPAAEDEPVPAAHAG